MSFSPSLDAYAGGYLAAERRMTASTNPHLLVSAKRLAWADGYRDACADRLYLQAGISPRFEAQLVHQDRW